MKPQQIQVLVAIAEHGSLRAAARSLGKSQPALTQSLKQAEDELGIAVFLRTSRGSGLFPSALKPLAEGHTDLLVRPAPAKGLVQNIEKPINIVKAF